MNKKELVKYYRSVEKSNAAFKKMNRARKRVQIAKDVIKQISLKRFSTEMCGYFEVAKNPNENEKRLYGKDLQGVLKKTPTCYVCGIGAVFVAAVDRLNKIQLSVTQDGRNIYVEYLNKLNLFTQLEMTTIEHAFEGWERFSPWRVPKQKFETTENTIDRLARIMEVIISHKGMPFTEKLFFARL